VRTFIVVWLVAFISCSSGNERITPPGRVPGSYRIAYRVEVGSGKDRTVSFDTVTVRRPFDAMSVVRARGQELSRSVSTFGRSSFRGSSVAVPPGPASFDLRPDVLMGDPRGRIAAAGSAEVAGRRCRRLRIAGEPTTASLGRIAGTVRSYSEVCVDDDGLVLSSERIEDGRRQSLRRATSVDATSVDQGDVEGFDVRAPQGDPRQVGSVKELEETSRLPGSTFWELSSAPDGFARKGRYAVVPPAQEGFSDPIRRGSITAFVSEVWTKGPDVFVIEQGATQGSSPFAADRNATRVDVGDLGRGELRLGLRESEVRVRTTDVRFVSVHGTLPPKRLLAIARSLQGEPGGPLRVKGER
jgi:hypothetical protein